MVSLAALLPVGTVADESTSAPGTFCNPVDQRDPFAFNSPGWMLLSPHKLVTASSELPGFPSANAHALRRMILPTSG